MLSVLMLLQLEHYKLSYDDADDDDDDHTVRVTVCVYRGKFIVSNTTTGCI